MSRKIVTLLTDFGTKDGYVGSIKGTIKNLFAEVDIVDISHDINPFDIKEAAFVLHTYYASFPKETIHLVVVDPGVGGDRMPLLIRTAQHFFIGPDNGVFKFIFSREAYTAYKINVDDYILDKGFTFHGRDIFAPAAAKILKGVAPEKMGLRLDDRTEIPTVYFTKESEGKYNLEAISIDRFGNIITGFSKRDMEKINETTINSIVIKNKTITEMNAYYSQNEQGDVIALWNSMGFLEIAVVSGNAQKTLNFDKYKDNILISIS